MRWVVKTNVGVVRSENQDRAAVLTKDGQVLVILCDGMGGHEGGSHASSITVDTFEKLFTNFIPENKISKWFEKALNLAIKEMIKFANGNPALLDMGTTVTAALITKQNVYIFNIGDSRTYIYNDLLYQITKDHNVRNYYVDKYNYTPEEAAMLIPAAALTYSLGPEKKAKVDTFVVRRDQKTKYVILTSDGIHDYVSKPLFEQILNNNKSLEGKSLDLIKAAIRGKSSDNLTIAIVDLEN